MKIHPDWIGNKGASTEALEALRVAAPRHLPIDYYQLLAFSDGGECSCSAHPFNFCLDSADTASDVEQIAIFHKIAPGLFVFGSDGGGQLFAFDLRGSEPWPIVTFDGVDLDGSIATVASSFTEFLKLVG
ncbi:SMI1/KNR4 family protein [Pseudomonas sp. SAICEU22]|uniref:SMI1/KNR4 family protein n=1 Tax=Pseudomonas agronomica TaxID=2979328 RepID=A0ABT3FBU6_9PSED|nr:SMI1/KNR4 family protein [Pseudomonas agronomica]MCW1246535.1 SMI1/KNR4 family protein [Pseudomonas agronomica]